MAAGNVFSGSIRKQCDNGMELTCEEAEAYLAEGATVDLSDEEMAKVAGGLNWSCAAKSDCGDKCYNYNPGPI